MAEISDLPTLKRRTVYELMKVIGFDVRSWAFSKTKSPASNPKYCYEWAFTDKDERVAVNVWHRNLKKRNATWMVEINAERTAISDPNATRRRRAQHLNRVLAQSYAAGLPVHVVLLAGNAKRVFRRALDSQLWAVTDHRRNGAFILTRGKTPSSHYFEFDERGLDAREGKKYRQIIWARERERKIRAAKIAAFAKEHNGRIFCEVAGCEFDFERQYGELGRGYIHVHHKNQLSKAPIAGRKVTKKDLNRFALVCPNCHAMIHLGNQCRPLRALITRKPIK